MLRLPQRRRERRDAERSSINQTNLACQRPTSIDRVRYRQTSTETAIPDWDTFPSRMVSSPNSPTPCRWELPVAHQLSTSQLSLIVHTATFDRVCDSPRLTSRCI